MNPGPKETILLLGATGYIGSQLLILLAKEKPQFHVAAFARNVVKAEKLKAIHGNLSIVEGTLADLDLVEKEATKAKYVLNCGDSNDIPSVKGMSRICSLKGPSH